MSPLQIANILKTKLLARTWSVSGEKVFAYNSVKITNNPERQAFLTLPTPFALIIIGDFQSDPVHGEEPEYLIGSIVVKVGVSGQDAIGEAVIAGSARVANSSRGAGLETIGTEVLKEIDFLNKNLGVSIQFMAKGNTQAVPETEGHYRAFQDYAFECIASRDDE